MRLTCDVQIGEQRAAFSAGRSGFGIDGDASHAGEVDHKSVVAQRLSGDVVAAGANGHWQAGLARKGDGFDDVGRICAIGDDRGRLIDHAVPHPARRVIIVIAGQNQRS